MNKWWFNALSLVVAGLLTVAILFLPLFAFGVFKTWLMLESQGSLAGTTVGIGVILRATVRRLFRTGARSVLQTTVGTFTRTTARAITRRVVRVAVKSFTLVFKEGVLTRRQETTEVVRVTSETKGGDHSSQVAGNEVQEDIIAYQHPAAAIALGFGGLFLSLFVILYILSFWDTPYYQAEPQIGAVLATTPFAPLQFLPAATDIDYDPGVRGILNGMSIYVAAFLGAVPVLVYFLLVVLAAKWQSVEASFLTAADGLILQAYFTGGLSFLPLTTDVHYKGSVNAKSNVALISLGGLFLIHAVLLGLAKLLSYYPLDFASAMFLLYCFVYSFPIRPLDGQYLWARSRWLWLVVFVPILASFILNIPESFNAIL